MFDKPHFDFIKEEVFKLFSEHNEAGLLLEESFALIRGYMFDADILEYKYLIRVWYDQWADKLSKRNSETSYGTFEN